MFVGLDGGPVRPQAHLRRRPGGVLAWRRCCAAWRRASSCSWRSACCRRSAASMLNPVAMSIITNTFTDPRERAQAVGVWGAVFGVSMALGPVVGGTLVSAIGWRSIFWINVPIGLAAIVLTLRFIPESGRRGRAGSIPSARSLVIVLLATLTFGIIEAPSAAGPRRSSWRRSRRRRRRCVGPARLRAAPRGAADRPAVLPLDPVRVVDRHLGRRVRRVRRLPLPQHALPPGRARPLAGPGRAGHRADGAHDRGGLAAVGPDRRPPRPAAAAR